MDEEIRKEIERILLGTSGRTDAWLFYTKAPFDAPIPFCVFEVIASEGTKDTKDSYVTFFLQFSVYDNSVNPTEAERFANEIASRMDESEKLFRLTNWKLISVDEVRPARTTPDEDFLQVSFDIRMKLERIKITIDVSDTLNINESIQT